MRPVMRYHGGKFMLAPWIIGHLPKHRCYVEPFAGAASVLLRKPRSYAEVYNDLDGEVCNVFRVLRDEKLAERLQWLVERTPFAREEFELSYLLSDDPVEQARRTVFRSFAGFGSAAASKAKTGFRANSNRSGTTPAHDWANIPAHVAEWSERFRGVVIENRDALAVIAAHDGPETLHYVDPPYAFETRYEGAKTTGAAYKHEMSDDQHRNLLEELRKVAGMVVLSGYRCPLYDDALGDWTRMDRAALADGAKARVESLWLNPATVARTQVSLFAEAA